MWNFIRQLVRGWHRGMEYEAMENLCIAMLKDGRDPGYVDKYYRMRLKEINSR
jgi:hypothetical protein